VAIGTLLELIFFIIDRLGFDFKYLFARACNCRVFLTVDSKGLTGIDISTEVAQVSFGSVALSGRFILSWGLYSTQPIPFNATESELANFIGELPELSNIKVQKVTNTTGFRIDRQYPSVWSISFAPTFSQQYDDR
jgi:hypothetical protein